MLRKTLPFIQHDTLVEGVKKRRRNPETFKSYDFGSGHIEDFIPEIKYKKDANKMPRLAATQQH
jgi:hypothetical protein